MLVVTPTRSTACPFPLELTLHPTWKTSCGVQARACDCGARSPVNFQSVMDSPERVRRVMPPRTTMLATHPAHPPSHSATALLAPALRQAPSSALAGACSNAGPSQLYADVQSSAA